ncbi:MAG: sigma-54-dependent transcriptional regulator, partial [bacterium]
MKTIRILLIDDDESLLKVIAHQLKQTGYEVTTATRGEEGIEIFKGGSFEVVITDLALPKMNGIDVLKEVKRLSKESVVIIITAFGTIENALEACTLGADDYLTKPFSREQLRFVLEKALRVRNLNAENVQLKSELLEKYDFSNIVAKSGKMQEVLKMVGQVAVSDATVLILGESGTGKELVARAIHYNSLRKDKAFITVNCPSIPENLLESELFGHVRGAYTGATKDRRGKFEQADGGTIFLDEIGDLKPELQAKLLRVLQEREIERVGGDLPIKVDIRILAATNQDLEERVKAGAFREDLYYRLTVVPIKIPPLRERKQEIPYLVDHFMHKFAHGRQLQVSEQALQALLTYDWPGNVRELENAIERAAILTSTDSVTSDELPPQLKSTTHDLIDSNIIRIPDEGLALEEIERQCIQIALEKSDGNQSRAAKFLQVPRHILLYRMKKLGLGSKFKNTISNTL